MPYNPDGSFTPLYDWKEDRDNGIDILADRHRANDMDAAAAISLALKRDGSSTVTQNIPMGGKRLTGLGAAVDPNDAVRKQQLDDALSPGTSNIGDYLTTERAPGSNWLKRDGAVYNQATYPDLAALLGTKYAGFSGFALASFGTSDNINAMAYGAGLLVAVCDGGVIRTSPTGAVWTTRTSGTSSGLLAIVFAAGQFVVVGMGGVCLTSPDGINWTTRTSGTANNLWGIAYGASRFVAVGESATIRVSSDAVIWGGSTISGFTENLYSIAYGNSRFVVGGGSTGAAAVSTDAAATWSWSRTGYPGGHVSTAYGKGRFIMNGGNSVYLSRAGAGSWQTAPLTGNAVKVAFGLGQFFAVGTSFTTSSIDGDSWATHTPITGTMNAIGFTATDVYVGGGGGVLAKGTRALDITTQFQLPADNPDNGYIKAL